MNNLVVDQLSFERDDIKLFERVSAEWHSGDIVQLTGHNGAGKTTLMRLIVGLLTPYSGTISWNEKPVTSYEFSSNLLYLGHQIGIKATMTPYENLHWYFSLNGTKSKESTPLNSRVFEAALDKVGLKLYRDVPCYQLSAGQQRRVALARLILSKAALWVLDEPFTAIDKAGVSDIEGIIEAHAESGGMVILTTHQAWNSARVKNLNMEQFKPRPEYLHD